MQQLKCFLIENKEKTFYLQWNLLQLLLVETGLGHNSFVTVIKRDLAFFSPEMYHKAYLPTSAAICFSCFYSDIYKIDEPKSWDTVLCFLLHKNSRYVNMDHVFWFQLHFSLVS